MITIAHELKALPFYPLADLLELQGELKDLTERNAAKLRRSIAKHGIFVPFFIWPAPDGNTYILDGHQRKRTLVKDGYGSLPVPCVLVHADTLPEAKEKLLVISSQYGRITQEGFDEFTFDLPDVGELVHFDALAFEFEQDEEPAGTGDAEPQIDRAAELQEKWQTERGQLWAIGEHRLLCGDSTVRADVERVMGGEVPDLIIADPPYGVSIVAANGYVGGGESANGMIPFGGVKKAKRLGSTNGAKPFGSKNVRGSDGASNIVQVGKYAPIIGDETTDTAKQSSSLLLDMYPKAVHSWWGANYYTDALSPSPCWLVWNKETTGNFADCELAWTNQDKAAKLFTHRWNGMLRDSERERRWHPTQKPAALALWVIDEFAIQGIVLDPFAGAGWSMIAAENAGIKGRAIEKSHEYVAVVLQRMADAFPGIEIHQLP